MHRAKTEFNNISLINYFENIFNVVEIAFFQKAILLCKTGQWRTTAFKITNKKNRIRQN